MIRRSGDQDIRIPGNYEIKESKNQEISLQNNMGPRNQRNTVAGFETLWVWQKAHKLMQEIHTFTKTLPKAENYALRDQIERCSSSVCDNIAEGYSAYYYKEKIKGFYIARKEAGETQNQIRKLSGKNYLNSEQSQNWVEEYEEIIRGINGYVRYIKKKRLPEK